MGARDSPFLFVVMRRLNQLWDYIKKKYKSLAET